MSPASSTSVLLAPGAGSDRDHPSLVLIEQQLVGTTVVRMDFPYRKAGRSATDGSNEAGRASKRSGEAQPPFHGRKFPDKTPILLDAVRAEADALAPAKLVLGGRSMGGRMCSMAVAAGLPDARGLVLICYPLHPPGKPDRLRTEHFEAITVPCLFISGTRDAFGTREELEKHTALIPGPVTHVWLEGSDHSLRRRDQVVADTAVAWIQALISGQPDVDLTVPDQPSPAPT